MIFRKTMALLMCAVMSAAVMASCGKEIEVEDSSSSKTSVSGTSDERANVDIANYTAPEKGETIIIMKIRDYGEVKIKLFPEYADKGVENFVELAKKGYYDGLTFHRVIKDFMIQGGDPLGIGTGGESIWGGKFDGGTDPHLIHAAGAVAYANSGAVTPGGSPTASDGSQFYIVTGTLVNDETFDYYEQNGLSFSEQAKKIYQRNGGAPWLDGSYTVFGQVFEGLDIIFRIQNVTTDQSNNMPMESVIMDSVTVGEYDGEELKWFISDYDYEEPTEETTEAVDISDYPVANFTAPEEGETVVSMKIEGYDNPVKIKLFPEYADKGVENFVELAKSGYYDGLTFHRVIEDFMIQGGDPEGNGTGGESIWGGEFDGGTDPHLIHAPGAIAYANSGSTATNGSQFYIVTGDKLEDSYLSELESYGFMFSDEAKDIYAKLGGVPHLDGSYTVFGQVFDGLDTVFAVQSVSTEGNDKPVDDVIIESVTVEQYSGEELRWYISDYEE